MKKGTSILLLLLLCFPVYSQDDNQTKDKANLIEIYFDQGSYTVDRTLRENEKSIVDFINSVDLIKRDTASIIQMIEVNSYTSPEGGKSLNDKLSQNRSETICKFIETECKLSHDLIVVRSDGIWWDELRNLVEKSDMEYQDEVLAILDNTEEETWVTAKPTDKWLTMVDSRNKQLMELKGGAPYKYMNEHLFPMLRRSTIRAAYFTNEPEPQEVFVVAEPEPKEEVAIVEIIEPEPEPQPMPESTIETKPLFAVKTNLLYDAVSALNVELEIPVGERWSIAGEWIFPWWSSSDKESSNRNCFQLLNGNIEGKYWFGDRTARPVMTGWHLGLYAGGGLYDLERDKEGYQGEFFIAAGLSGGYAHTINKSGNLRMEYSVAVGYLKTDYDKYAEHWGIDNSWHTIRQESGNYTWIGPTRAKVSLVWMLNRKVNKEK